MAELILREQLQPGLLDRLSDDERFLIIVQLTCNMAELRRHRLSPQHLIDFLRPRGFRETAPGSRQGDALGADEQDIWLAAPGRSASLQQLRELVIRSPGGAGGGTLQSLCMIHAGTVRNTQVESMERRTFTMRRLREAVFRDLNWLLNCASLDSIDDLHDWPQVSSSVLNYGMPSLAGTPASSIDVRATADRIARAIRNFEPRLTKVRVLPEVRDASTNDFALEFRIEAELWGQPVPQALVMRTSIDLNSGEARLAEAAGH
jgi:type VI secretion system protein ImpF